MNPETGLPEIPQSLFTEKREKWRWLVGRALSGWTDPSEVYVHLQYLSPERPEVLREVEVKIDGPWWKKYWWSFTTWPTETVTEVARPYHEALWLTVYYSAESIHVESLTPEWIREQAEQIVRVIDNEKLLGAYPPKRLPE